MFEVELAVRLALFLSYLNSNYRAIHCFRIGGLFNFFINYPIFIKELSFMPFITEFYIFTVVNKNTKL